MNKIEVNIVSHPKSGRTWLRALLGEYIAEKYNIFSVNLLETASITKKAKLHPTHFTHDGSSWLDKFSTSSDKSKYFDKKVILLERDPFDTLTSSYFQVNQRECAFNGSISDFIRSEKYGIQQLLEFYYIWKKNKNVPRDFLHITYEEMHADIYKVLKNVLLFIGDNNIDLDILEKSINVCSFENLKKAEKVNKYNSFRLEPVDKNNPESYKVRRGKIGGYVDYLSEEDINYLELVIKEFNQKNIL